MPPWMKGSMSGIVGIRVNARTMHGAAWRTAESHD